MPAPVFFDEDIPYDSDTVKVAESPTHRQACDVIGLATVDLVGPDHDVFRDMNWYPTDGANPIAPDVMVLPAGVVAAQTSFGDDAPRSYRQDTEGGPDPSVVIEVPSYHDTHVALTTKIDRCRRLGVVVYLVDTAGVSSVLRFDPNQASPQAWTGRPIPELGGLRILFETNGDIGTATLVVEMPDGIRARTDHELMTARTRAQAERAEAEASQAKAELEALRLKLRNQGIKLDPEG